MPGRVSSVLARVAGAVRSLLGGRRTPPERPFVEPFAGEYRTRPFLPPPPPPPPPPVTPLPPAAERPRAGSIGLVLLGLAFVACGVLLVLAPRKPADAFWGWCSIGFFGFATWVFLEQLLSRKADVHASPATLARVLAGLFLVGSGALYLSWTSTAVPLPDRWMVGLFGLAFLVLTLVAAIMGHRNGRLWRRRRGKRR